MSIETNGLPRNRYIRTNLVHVEIPKEVRHFAQLKILTEYGRGHNERYGNSLWRPAEWRRSEQWNEGSEASQEQRTTARRGGGARGDVNDDVTDLITHVHMKLSVQLESHVRDVAHKERVVNSPKAEGGSPHVWFFMAMMNAIEKNPGTQDRQRKTDPPRLGRGGAVGTLRKAVENSTTLELNVWVFAYRHLPTFTRLIIHTSRGLSSLPMNSSPTNMGNRKERTSGVHHMRRWRRF